MLHQAAAQDLYTPIKIRSSRYKPLTYSEEQGQPYSLTSFGLGAGFLSDLTMCIVAKGWHIINLFLANHPQLFSN
tara:strand:- start:602 stop:826 length:225 start_codon:yes stop_codon:yes gene_type:complete